MYEYEPELDGDLDWALFPAPERIPSRRERITTCVKAALVIGACWFITPALGITAACAAVSLKDLSTGRRLARVIPDRTGARVCSWFSYAWGCWKVGMTALGTFFLLAALQGGEKKELSQPSPEMFGALAGCLFLFGGFLASAGFTAAGLIAALRSGMRVWIGEGMNQARTLLLAMLLAMFTCFVLIPWTVLLGRFFTRTAVTSQVEVGWSTSYAFLGALLILGMGLFLFAAPIFILIMLDRLCRRVVAGRPGKFGPKVPSVGKWNT